MQQFNLAARSFNLLIAGLLCLALGSCGGRCSSKPTPGPLKQFGRPLADLVPVGTDVCLTIDNLKKLQPRLVGLLQTLFPRDSVNWIELIKRLTAVELEGSGVAAAGIDGTAGAVLFVYRKNVVLLLALSDLKRFDKALKRLMRLRGYRRWTNESQTLAHLADKGSDSKKTLMTLARYKNVALLVFPFDGKPASNVVAQITTGPHGTYASSPAWKSVLKSEGVRFLATPKQLLSKSVAEMFDKLTGTLQIQAKKIELAMDFWFNRKLMPDLQAWFRPKSPMMPAVRIIDPSIPLRGKLDLDLSQMSGLLSTLKLIGLDALAPLRKTWPKDPHLDVLAELFKNLTGRALLLVHAPRIKLEPADDNDESLWIKWLQYTHYTVVLQLTNPARSKQVLDLLTEMIPKPQRKPPATKKPAAKKRPPGPPKPAPKTTDRRTAKRANVPKVAKILALRKYNWRCEKQRSGRDTFYLLKDRSGRLVLVFSVLDSYLFFSTRQQELSGVLAFYRRNIGAPARFRRPLENELFFKTHLTSGFLEMKNLVKRLISGGLPPGMVSTIRRVRQVVFIIDVRKNTVQLKATISL